jgi:hypothetical protein
VKRQRGSSELLIVLVLALVASLIANVLIYRGMQKATARAVTAEANLTTANRATKQCNDSIAGLEEAARKRGIAAGVARERARRAAQDLEAQAQGELSTPATTPGDDCKSAQDRVDRILRKRAGDKS